jgi:copper chaperone
MTAYTLPPWEGVRYRFAREKVMADFTVEGMSCQHCVKAVTRAVTEIDPKAQVQVDLMSGNVRVDSNATPEAIRAAIDDAGYTVAPA